MQSRVLYKLANTYKNERQYTEAARVYSRILELDPKNEAARLELARLFYRARQWVNCARTLKEYFKDQKKPAKDVQSMYMEALFNSRQYKEAAQVASEYLKTEPTSPLANRALALGFFNDKQYSQAIDAYKKLSKLDTMEFDDYRRLGYAYRQVKKDSLGIATYEEALRADTTQPNIVRANLYGEIGSYYMNNKKWELAGEFFQKRLQLDSTAVGASINYASCLIQLDQYERASLVLKKAIVQNPKYPPAYVNLGFCYYQMKDFDAGRKEFETAIKVIDTAETKYKFELADANRMIALAMMLEKKNTPEASQKKWEDAISYLKKSVKYKDDVAQTHLLLGQCYQNLNKKEDGIKEYKRTLQIDSKNEQAKKGLKDLQPE
jgi:superkiller protein 3